MTCIVLPVLNVTISVQKPYLETEGQGNASCTVYIRV